MKTDVTDSDTRRDAANIHATVSNVHHSISDANFVSNVHHDVSNTHVVISGAHRNTLKGREDTDRQNPAVGASCVLPTTK